MALPLKVARLLRRAGQGSRRFAQALLGKPDPTIVEYVRNSAALDDLAEPSLEHTLTEIEEQLAVASGATDVLISRYYLRVEALTWTSDDKELAR